MDDQSRRKTKNIFPLPDGIEPFSTSLSFCRQFSTIIELVLYINSVLLTTRPRVHSQKYEKKKSVQVNETHNFFWFDR